eukprot:Phypoly_transcript_11208.p1 GENE.Phypoly_transcript_11208~~Phypoly_transcript_11208.p1  ORF type:complete len:330 (+),score=58.02 Phypoly_transcript_11208:130-1119(+)
MIARCCYLAAALGLILVFLFTCFFHILSDTTCEGEWGVGNLGEQKNGIGRCVWKFGVTSVLTNSSVFMRETIYEGSWRNGHKNGFGRYKSFSNIVYEGFWNDNKREGDGIMIINEKTKYTGKWFNDTLTCDDATLILQCNSSCLQYPSLLLEGAVTYKGKVVRGLPHGTGTLTFSDSPRKIQITFHSGMVLDHSRGSLGLSNGRIVQIETFRETWGLMQQTHTAHAELAHTSPSGKRTSYIWDGERVVMDKEVWFGAQNATTMSEGGEVYELLNALKWFEYHFMKTQVMLESEVYAFDTAEQHKKELDKKMEEKMEAELKERVQGKQEL